MVQRHLKKDWTRNIFLLLFWSINNNYDLLLNKEKRQATNLNKHLREQLAKIQLVTNYVYLMRIVKRNRVC